MAYFLQLMVSGALSGTVYALIALGIIIVYKSSSVFNFAIGGIVALSAFILWQLTADWGWSLLVALPTYLAILILMGAVIQRLILQPLTGQPLMAAIMATLALADVFTGSTILFWPGPGRNFPEVIPNTTLHAGPAVLSTNSLIILAISLVAYGVFLLFFHRTKVGLAMRGTAEDHSLAQSEGIKVNRIFVLSWAIAIIIAAIGGTLMSTLYGVSLDPLNALGLKSLAVVILGGLESVGGALLGGLIIGLLEVLGSGYLDPYVGGGSGEVVPFVVMLVFLIFKPYGIFGYKRIERV